MKIYELTQDTVWRIRGLTEKVISETGFRVENRELREIAERSGAMVDHEEMVVKIPKELLSELISKVPPSYEERGINGDSYTVGSGNQYIHAIVTDPRIIDYETGRTRLPCINDVVTNTILSQMNPDVAAIGRMDFPVTDFTDAFSSYKALEAHLLNHDKHYAVYTANYEDLMIWMELGGVLNGGNDISGSKLMTVAVAVISPFVLADFNSRALLEAASRGFTVVPTICPMAGMTSPYSVAGTLLQGNIENIFIAALSQMVNPGNPFLYAFGPSVCDMKTGNDMYYTFDKVLWKLASIELAKSYNLPCGTECGGTMLPSYDMQSGAESMLFMLTAVASQADILAGIGSCFNANGLSSEMILIQQEWLKVSKHIKKGIDAADLDDSLRSISEQGIGGNFLTDDLTLQNLRSGKIYIPGIIDYSEPILKKAHKKIREICEGFTSPVPGDIQEGIRKFFHDFYKGRKNI